MRDLNPRYVSVLPVFETGPFSLLGNSPLKKLYQYKDASIYVNLILLIISILIQYFMDKQH